MSDDLHLFESEPTNFIKPAPPVRPSPLASVCVWDEIDQPWTLVFDPRSGHGSLHGPRVWLVRRGKIFGDPPIGPREFYDLAVFYEMNTGRHLQWPPTVQFFERHRKTNYE